MAVPKEIEMAFADYLARLNVPNAIPYDVKAILFDVFTCGYSAGYAGAARYAAQYAEAVEFLQAYRC
jgi:hypothetical protein